MSQIDIVHLDSYRMRRNARFRRTLALHGHEADRSKVLQDLWQAVTLVGADRGAVVWLDEYGPGLAHPQTLLDLAADRPRRFFSPIPLRTAWETGVPGLLDLPQADGRWEKLGGGIASACVVALGSDGPRSWFLVADSLTPRPALTKKVAGELMFVAGEVASVVLHRDLDRVRAFLGSEVPAEAAFRDESGSFSGWPVLKDLEGRRGDDEVSRRIGNRFLVARVVRGLVEDDLVTDPESVAHQVKGVREELGSHGGNDPEAMAWDRVLREVAASDHGQLVAALLEWGRVVEGQGHLNGAVEILGLAYELAKATGSADAAADAARFQGKVFRTRAEWAQATAWYEVARGIAEEAGNPRKLAAVLDGLANAYRDRGNLPRAREVLQEVLEMGREIGDRYALAIAHHDLMTVEKLSGDLVGAIQHGWLAVQSYDSRDGSLRALFDLAGVLRESGELSAAWDAYSVVAGQVEGLEARVLALDALAFVAALKGDRGQHDYMRKRLDAEGWEEVSPVYRGQILFYRGMSCRALGDEVEGRAWLSKALGFAEEHGLNKLIFDAETALKESALAQALQTVRPAYQDSTPEEILGVRRGLREMREAQAGVGGSV
jgi:tetratricopeptide (TPR) repeat protein